MPDPYDPRRIWIDGHDACWNELIGYGGDLAQVRALRPMPPDDVRYPREWQHGWYAAREEMRDALLPSDLGLEAYLALPLEERMGLSRPRFIEWAKARGEWNEWAPTYRELFGEAP